MSRALKEEEEFYLQRDAVQMLWRKYKQNIHGTVGPNPQSSFNLSWATAALVMLSGTCES